jgi:GT2 family glycosyltransferase
MRVSILIPTLNRRDYLAEALASCLNQQLLPYEILISDDGSTDGTRDTVQQIAAQEPCVRLLTENPRPSIFDNFNYLISEASGDAFCILGDDDVIEPDYLARLVAALSHSDEVVAAFCDHTVIDGEGRLLSSTGAANSELRGRTALAEGLVAEPLQIALAGTLCVGFALFRSSVFRKEAFDLTCKEAADVDYAIRAASLGGLFYVKNSLARYRQHAGTATQSRSLSHNDGLLHALTKYRFRGADEALRRKQLAQTLLSRAQLLATTDRMAALTSAVDCLAMGGSPWRPRWLVAVALAASPRPIAVRVQRSLRKLACVVRSVSATL